MNMEVDHVNLLLNMPPRMSILELIGVLKGRAAIRVYDFILGLRKKSFFGNYFSQWGIEFGCIGQQ